MLFAKVARRRLQPCTQSGQTPLAEILSEFWDGCSESTRAKVAEPQAGTTYGQSLVSNLVEVARDVQEENMRRAR